MLDHEQLAMLRFDDQGLLPAVVQQHDTGEVLMVAWMSEASLARTMELGETVFYSRSRQQLWHKGATSGNTQRVVQLRLDCDGDTVLVLVDAAGPACHTGQRTCFHRHLSAGSTASSDPPPPGPSPSGAPA